MATIRIGSREITCENNENLYRVLTRNGVSLNAPCGGAGTCGKCRVEIDGIGLVKSCEYTIRGDITITLPAQVKSAIETKGLLRDVPAVNKNDMIAVDIGTTTVVAYLIRGGVIIDSVSRLNAQKPWGDDVISRIKYTMDNPEGTELLHNAIYTQLEEMTEELRRKNSSGTRETAIAANTTMLHLFANISPASIGTAPFTPAFTGERTVGGYTLLPSVSGYVGADITAAVLACGIHESEEIVLLIDIGTNGEIALGNKDFILTCATAAGPAFEGAQISCGVGGITGAIDRVHIGENGEIDYTTIGSAPPVGLCGSGILDAAAEMLRAGIIDESGYFEDEELEIAPGITITAADIRQIQLAKAAVAAGVNTLLEEGGIDIADISACCLAGGFGSRLRVESACAIGLIRRELHGKITAVGNAAGMGAVLWQINPECRAQTADIARNAKYFELSGSAVFNREFMNQMSFETE